MVLRVWDKHTISALFEQSMPDLIYRAQQVHRAHFDANEIQIATLLSVKTGACPEDCKYCSQSVRYKTDVQRESFMDHDKVLAAAKQAKASGASRFCMAMAWRQVPKKSDFEKTLGLIKSVKALGLETCLSMGMLSAEQATILKEEGLDYYNHNLDTSEAYYKKIITTRTYQNRLDTLAHVAKAGLKVCCGGIVDMGESREDRVGLLWQLTQLDKTPESVPINRLIRVPGTPFAEMPVQDDFEFVRTVAAARIILPKARIRLSAGREHMSDMMQAMCFMAGANSIFCGEKLLTTPNPEVDEDEALFDRLGLQPYDLRPTE